MFNCAGAHIHRQQGALSQAAGQKRAGAAEFKMMLVLPGAA
jgi:hypothetical protein